MLVKIRDFLEYASKYQSRTWTKYLQKCLKKKVKPETLENDNFSK